MRAAGGRLGALHAHLGVRRRRDRGSRSGSTRARRGRDRASSSSTSRRSPTCPTSCGRSSAPARPASAGTAGSSGLALHLSRRRTARRREEAVAWVLTDEGKAFYRGAADAWGDRPRRRRRRPRHGRPRSRRRPTRSTPESQPATAEDAGGPTRGADGCRGPRHPSCTSRSTTATGLSSECGGAGAPAATAEDSDMTLFDGITARIVETPRTGRQHPRARGRRPCDAAGAHRRAGPRQRLVVAVLAGAHAGPAARPAGHRDRPARIRRHRARARSTPRAACATSATTSHATLAGARHPDGAPRRLVDGRAASSCSTRWITRC